MNLSAFDLEQVVALLGTAQHEILSVVPSWPNSVRNAFLSQQTAFRPSTRIVIPRPCRVQATRPVAVGHTRLPQMRLGNAISPFILVVDRKTALVKCDDQAAAASVARPAELDRLIATFKDRWDRSSPITPTPTRPLSGLQLSIVRRLAMGMTDEATAKALKISSRTVQRQVSDVMEQLGARSRLELGVHLAAADLV